MRSTPIALIVVAFLGLAGSDHRSCPEENMSHAKRVYTPIPLLRDLVGECEEIAPPTLELEISVKGLVSSKRLLKSSGCPAADDRLQHCMGFWRFEPATCDGQAVTDKIILTINWHVEEVSTAEPCGPEPEADGEYE